MATRPIAFLAAVLACLSATYAEAEPAGALTLQPAPRAEGGLFTNPAGDFSHGSFGVRFPFFMRRIAGTFRSRPGAPEIAPNDGGWLRENARHSIPTVTWVGHSTLLVQMDHVTFLTDPTWSKTARSFSSIRLSGQRAKGR